MIIWNHSFELTILWLCVIACVYRSQGTVRNEHVCARRSEVEMKADFSGYNVTSPVRQTQQQTTQKLIRNQSLKQGWRCNLNYIQNTNSRYTDVVFSRMISLLELVFVWKLLTTRYTEYWQRCKLRAHQPHCDHTGFVFVACAKMTHISLKTQTETKIQQKHNLVLVVVGLFCANISGNL